VLFPLDEHKPADPDPKPPNDPNNPPNDPNNPPLVPSGPPRFHAPPTCTIADDGEVTCTGILDTFDRTTDFEFRLEVIGSGSYNCKAGPAPMKKAITSNTNQPHFAAAVDAKTFQYMFNVPSDPAPSDPARTAPSTLSASEAGCSGTADATRSGVTITSIILSLTQGSQVISASVTGSYPNGQSVDLTIKNP
jgi:hypothetical protein